MWMLKDKSYMWHMTSWSWPWPLMSTLQTDRQTAMNMCTVVCKMRFLALLGSFSIITDPKIQLKADRPNQRNYPHTSLHPWLCTRGLWKPKLRFWAPLGLKPPFCILQCALCKGTGVLKKPASWSRLSRHQLGWPIPRNKYNQCDGSKVNANSVWCIVN